MKTVILTSATLTINHRFDYFRDRLGLNEVQHRLQDLGVPSSFRYREQVLLAIPNDVPLPGDSTFDETLAAMLQELMTLIQGRTLVLFTSYTSLERVFHGIHEALEEAGIETLAQRISGSRHYIAERFRQNTASVLFGTKSFWEGIDVPGEALQCVVIVKLPFAVPDDPIVQARCEYLDAQGHDSRLAYYEPLAIVQFKQGFGRLIRTATDHGAVIVFDRRLLTRSYGRRFLDSVPGYTFLNAPWYEVLARTRWWLTGGGG
jgi:ATP-dependent DNA helicase DinG